MVKWCSSFLCMDKTLFYSCNIRFSQEQNIFFAGRQAFASSQT